MSADTDVLPEIEAGANAAPPLHLVLIDGSGFIFRAYHALPPMTRPDGTPVNAVFEFSRQHATAKLLREHVGTPHRGDLRCRRQDVSATSSPTPTRRSACRRPTT